MIIQGPSPANVAPIVPQPQPVTQPNVTVQAVTFDLVAHQATIVYGQRQLLRIPMGPVLQQAVEQYVQNQVEADQGWAPGSSTVVTP